MCTGTSVVAAARELGERERAVLLALAQHKFFSTDQIQSLFCDSDRTAQRVLHHLRRDGFISSFEWQSSSRRRAANRHFLTPAGLKLVASLRGCRVAELGKIPAGNVAERVIQHRSGVNRFFCDLVALTLQKPGSGMETWRDEHKLITPFGEVQPDGFGRLLHPAGAVEFLFEYDLGTEHRRVLIDKLANYLRIASTWDSLDDKPFPNVLFVTTKDDRELELLRATLHAVKELNPERATSGHLPCTARRSRGCASMASSGRCGGRCSVAAIACASTSCRPSIRSLTISTIASDADSPRSRMPKRPTGNPAGRPAHDPIVLRAPKLVPLDDETRQAVVRILVELLDEWLRSKKATTRKEAV